MPYFKRNDSGGPSVLFIHGLGGAKENFSAALDHPALANCTLVGFDLPGTGQASYDPETTSGVSGLADLAQAVAENLVPGPYVLVGASMGGLITLLQIRRYGMGRITALVNIEGNLCAEDCMFSRRAVAQELAAFPPVYDQIMNELTISPFVGDRAIAYNMATNLDQRASHSYSFETVAESDSGNLLQEFLGLSVPRLFLYGEAIRSLSYLPRLRDSDVKVEEIPGSAYFLFYDYPSATFQAIGEFVHLARR